MLKKTIKKILSISIILIVLSGLGLFFTNLHIRSVGSRYVMKPEDLPQVDAIIVLGAYVSPSGRISDMLADRLAVGLELYKGEKAPKIVVSGDHGRTTYDEVNGMRKYLQARGVPREDIFMDHAGFDTYDSLYRARDVFTIKKAVVVTQQYHLLRALYIARVLGIEAYGVPSDKHVYPGMAYYQAREIAARAKAFLQVDIFKPKPKYLGNIIPISGNGILTDDGK